MWHLMINRAKVAVLEVRLLGLFTNNNNPFFFSSAITHQITRHQIARNTLTSTKKLTVTPPPPVEKK